MCLQCKQKQLINVVTRWPGSTHDVHIWNNCNVSCIWVRTDIHNVWLLGDSAYWLKPWLLTPVVSPSTANERKYNIVHKSTRLVIERTYGIWKMRFRCLYRSLTLSPIRNLNVVLATAGFHNKCLDRRIPLPTEDFEIDETGRRRPTWGTAER